MIDALNDVARRCIGGVTRRAARSITNFHNSLLRPLELSSEQFFLLTAISQSPDQPLSSIASSLTLDDSTINRNLGVLERKGLVRREGSFGRLGKRVSLTQSGEEVITRALPVWSWANDQLLVGLSEQEIAAGRVFLEALARAADDARARNDFLGTDAVECPAERIASQRGA
ncbi:MarR family transcriptional regulator [bacterium]|nr:MarR family transcriptional regulator [bacterium]